MYHCWPSIWGRWFPLHFAPLQVFSRSPLGDLVLITSKEHCSRVLFSYHFYLRLHTGELQEKNLKSYSRRPAVYDLQKCAKKHMHKMNFRTAPTVRTSSSAAAQYSWLPKPSVHLEHSTSVRRAYTHRPLARLPYSRYQKILQPKRAPHHYSLVPSICKFPWTTMVLMHRPAVQYRCRT